MSYMQGACNVSRLDRESNEDTYGRFGMSESAVRLDCGVVEWVKQSTLRWYGHVMRTNECDFTKRVYESTMDPLTYPRSGSCRRAPCNGEEGHV